MTTLSLLPRRTTAETVVVRGVGIHTGVEACVTLVPVERPGTGVLFRRRGGDGTGQEIAARASNVSETARCTVLSAREGVSVATVEHLLSALAGTEITDLVVDVEGPELPIGDGSALVWTEALRDAGTKEWVGEMIAPLMVEEPILLEGKNGAFIAAFPAEKLRLTTVIAFDHPLVGTQAARFEPGPDEAYSVAVAPARTFGFADEIEALLKSGLALGGSLENALIVYSDRFSAPLRFDNELARHKLLDLIGDLALVGRPLIADVIAHKPSHRLNTQFARLLEGH